MARSCDAWIVLGLLGCCLWFKVLSFGGVWVACEGFRGVALLRMENIGAGGLVGMAWGADVPEFLAFKAWTLRPFYTLEPAKRQPKPQTRNLESQTLRFSGLRPKRDMCVCVCVCTYVYLYVCVCVHVYA